MKRFTVSIERTKKGTFLVRGGIGRELGARKTYHEIGAHDEAIIDGKREVGRSLAKVLRDKLKEGFRLVDLGAMDPDLSVETLLGNFIQSLISNQYSENYIRNMKTLYQFFLVINVKTLSDISTHLFLEKLNSWKGSMLNQGYAISYIRGNLVRAHTFLKWLQVNKKIHHIPSWEGVLPRLLDPTPKFYTTEEWVKLDRALEINGDQDLRVGCYLAYTAGLRRSEICGLKGSQGVLWEDVQWLPDGGARIYLRKEIVKGKRKARMVPLTASMIALLGAQKTGPLVPLTGHAFYQRFKKVCAIAGIDAIATIHRLRHTFAKNFLQDGGGLKTLADFMGHRNSKITFEVYGHMEQSHYDDEMAKVFKQRARKEALVKQLQVIG